MNTLFKKNIIIYNIYNFLINVHYKNDLIEPIPIESVISMINEKYTKEMQKTR